MRSRRVSWKNMIFEWIFDAKMGGLEGWKRAFRLILVAKYDVSVFRKKASKRRAKSHPKWGQNRVSGALGSDFWDFGRFCERSDFWWIFDWFKNQKNPENRGGGAKRAIRRQGSAAEAGSPERLWSLLNRQESAESAKTFGTPCPLRAGGGGYLKAPPHAADPRK